MISPWPILQQCPETQTILCVNAVCKLSSAPPIQGPVMTKLVMRSLLVMTAAGLTQAPQLAGLASFPGR